MQYLKRLDSHGVTFKSYKEEFLDGTGIFKDAIIAILGALANQERVRLSERVHAGLERARKQGRVGGRPPKNYAHDKDAKRVRQMREDSQSYQEIAEELGRSKTNIHKLCNVLGCAPQESKPTMMVLREDAGIYANPGRRLGS